MKTNEVFTTPRSRKIGAAIDEGMVYAWLAQEADIWEIYFLVKKRNNLDCKFSEFADVFLAIAEHI